MKLWFRLLHFMIATLFRPKLDSVLDRSQLHFRVWPTDLDISMHMNNGRYLTIMDLGRMDIMVRSPLWKAVVKNRWTPVVSSSIIRFRRELRCFEPFILESAIVDWSEAQVIFEHRMIFTKGPRAGEVAAYALLRAGLYDRKKRAFVSIEELKKLTNSFPDRPELSPEIKAFIEAETSLHQSPRTKKIDEEQTT